MKPLTLAFCLLAAAQAQEPVITVGDWEDNFSDKIKTSEVQVVELVGEEYRELQPAGIEQVTQDLVRVVLVGKERPTPPPPTSAARGLFALQPGFQSQNDRSYPSGSRLVSVAQMRDPDCAGVTNRFSPLHVLNDNGSWNEDGWNKVGATNQRAREAGKAYKILPMGGLYAVNQRGIDLYDKIDDEVARRWGNDPAFAVYHVTGTSPPGTSEELYGTITPQIEAWTIHRIKHARKAMGPNRRIVVATGGGPSSWQAFKRIAEAVKDQGPIDWKHNRVKAFDACGQNSMETWPMVAHNRLLVELCNISPNFRPAGEMVGGTRENDPNCAKPRCGTRDIGDSIRQFAKVVKMSGEKPEECCLDVYPPDLAAMKASDWK